MQKPLADVFTWPADEPQLIGSRLVMQLRGQAGDRQVPGEPRVGYAQVYGAPGTAAVTILSR
jgi:hypothetical protein